ncbi:ribonuclease H [Sesbania bispinosa]|nr:ribonuclease H [Sesbania bispinosa]
MLLKSVCLELEKLIRQFIWGDSEDKRAWHLVSWENICKPKALGGLGFRRIHNFNCALLMKLGWQMITRPDAYWVRILKAKYSCGLEPMASVRKRVLASNTWRGITHTWPHVIRGLQWILGNGQKVKFWTDAWLPGGGLLLDSRCADIPIDLMELTVNDFVHNGAWDLTWICHYIPHHLEMDILSHPVPSAELGADQPNWSYNSDG